ncbi:hypothetical protein [Gramella sp. KN1008]|nr:hypothetical protein [Gramella sp. KN1008]
MIHSTTIKADKNTLEVIKKLSDSKKEYRKMIVERIKKSKEK